MSRGTKAFSYRIPPGLVDLVEATIKLRNRHADGQPWTQSDFIRVAILEKIRKMDRSRGRRIEETRVYDTLFSQGELFSIEG